MIAEDGLDRCRAQVLNLFGLVDRWFGRIAHGNNVVPRARAATSERPSDQVC
jgi:hypothetical protein